MDPITLRDVKADKPDYRGTSKLMNIITQGTSTCMSGDKLSKVALQLRDGYRNRFTDLLLPVKNFNFEPPNLKNKNIFRNM